MNHLPACMGGWCNQRGHCAHHLTAGREYPQPVERLCPRGLELPAPVVWAKPAEKAPPHAA